MRKLLRVLSSPVKARRYPIMDSGSVLNGLAPADLDPGSKLKNDGLMQRSSHGSTRSVLQLRLET